MLAMTVNDSEEAMRDLMTTGGWTFPVMLDADSAASAYGVRAVPTNVVIDSEGRVVNRIIGGVTASDLTTLIDGLSN